MRSPAVSKKLEYASRIERLIAVVQELSRARTLGQVQAIVRHAARDLTGADGATFVLRDGDQCYYADEEAIAPLWKGMRFPLSACVSGWAMMHRTPAVIEDIYADIRVPADAYRPTFVKSLAMVPIRTAQPIGAIGTYWAKRYLPTEQDVRLVQALADSTSIALENIELEQALRQKLEEQTATLTQLSATEADLRHELAERMRAEAHLSTIEHQLRQSQKMEAVGQLAGGVAHDFNNVLCAIVGTADLVLWQMGPDDPHRADVEEIQRAGARAAALTKQLLTFSRKQAAVRRIVSLNPLIEGVRAMLSHLIAEQVEMNLALAPDLRTIACDPAHLEQVILNLVVNARDAMPGHGRLLIETKNVHLDEEYTRDHIGVAAGEYVMLAVTDTGMGMSKETQARIFDPFFTTKEAGRGTGLGLSIVYGIVKQAGGHIWLYSEEGVGTTFKLYFPSCDAKASIEEPGAAPVDNLFGTESVLVVEDDEQVAATIRRILSSHGYVVQVARSPEEALALVRQPEPAYHLLLTDIVMPRMNGLDLVDAVRQHRPGLAALWMSGYTDDALQMRGSGRDDLVLIEKPITRKSLLEAIRRQLAHGAS